MYVYTYISISLSLSIYIYIYIHMCCWPPPPLPSETTGRCLLTGGARRPRRKLVVRVMQNILRLRLDAQIRNRILRAIFRPLTLHSCA